MSRRSQVYYHAILGAFGALFGWFAAGLLPGGLRGVDVMDAVLTGAVIGFFTGAFIGSAEGLLIKRTAGRSLVGAGLGALAGVISGGAGLALGWVAFVLTGGGLIGRALGFMAFGALLGASSGILGKLMRRATYGVVGGSLAGLAGGLIYEVFTLIAFRSAGETDTTQAIVGGIGVTLVGACLGGITTVAEAAIARVLDHGLLRVLNGARAGQEIRLGDPVTIGAYDGCRLYLPGDRAIQNKHALVSKQAANFVIVPAGSASVAVNGSRISEAGAILRPNDRIQIGSTYLNFIAD